ncbi:hypothetical protein EJ04DRAFT_508581 [Polyplosphaeria fusca]|uniref:Small ribosomal subunit protein mS35 mitochondrial conserved domain-containing protein n=1 Tax=Polyplosphaeria fusca TaxID=682080 RepID=A0A9P4V7X0_9PLEO|nr:hypothetical protein EJ04DRAFT_508581 [Polyplosphaeria fusca]
MASISRRLIYYTGKCPPRPSPRYAAPRHTPQWHRPISSTTARCVGNDPTDARVDEKAATVQPVENVSGAIPGEPKPSEVEKTKRPHLTRQERREFNMDQALRKLSEDFNYLNPDTVREATRQGKLDPTVGDEFEFVPENAFDIEQETGKLGFWAEGEEEMGPDEDYYGDDLTSLGHGELEQHRELREYARLAAWELPLLNQLARPFQLPTAATPFRFRYTSYMGEQHPAANKVVVEFSASDMAGLTAVQKNKLIKLSGPRYNPDTDIIKMSCELYDTLPQNKRFLGDSIAALLAEAKDGKDTFEDVPFDFRHHKPKVKHAFPENWILTEERKKYLEAKRAETLQLQDERLHNDLLVDGEKIIARSLPFVKEPELVAVPVGGARRR